MGALFGVTGAVVALVMVAFGISWATIHGIMELGQYAGLYDYEPTAAGSAFAALVWIMVKGLFRRAGGSA